MPYPWHRGAELLHHKGFDFLEELRRLVRVGFQLNGLGQIQTENTHNGFGVDGVASGNQIHIKVIFANNVYKALDIIDGVQHNVAGSHWYRPPFSIVFGNYGSAVSTLSIITIFTI